jgi:hypothetical protein
MPEGEGQTPDVLIKSLRTATDRANEASLEFDALMSAIPSGMHPEGVQRIQNPRAR